MRLLSVFALLLPLTGCPADGGSKCENVFGPEHIFLQMTAMAEGSYAWTVTSDEGSQHCTIVLGVDHEPVCDTGAYSSDAEKDETSGEWTFSGTFFTPQSETVHVTITQDGTTLVDEDVTPEWVSPDAATCPDFGNADLSYDLAAL